MPTDIDVARAQVEAATAERLLVLETNDDGCCTPSSGRGDLAGI